MKKLFLILIIGTLFFSCKKERTFHITAKNAVTGEPYPGLSYNIERSWSGSFENKYKTVGSGVLDENGEVYFTKRLHKNSSYSISVAAPSNTCYMNSSDLHAGGEKNFKAEFEFAGCSYRTLKINNVNCQGPNDLFDMDMHLVYDQNYTAFSFPEKSGCYSNEFINEKVPAGKWFVEWWVTRNGNTDYFTDTITLIENELFVYEINY